MKKTYEAPSVEKIAFKYREQVVAVSGGDVCTQRWEGFNDPLTNTCTHVVVNADSGMI